MLGVLVNTIGVILGSLLGLALRRGIPEKVSKAVMTAIALCVLYLGISGSLGISNAIVVILAMVLAAAVGTLLDIDGAVTRLGNYVEQKMRRPQEAGRPSISEGFVTASLLFCVGSMAIVGSLNAGLSNDNSMLFAKSVLDTVSAIMLSVSLGLGVMLSGLALLIYQGGIVLLAQVLRPILSAEAIALMGGTGSLLILALGLNMLGMTKIKVADFLPAILFAPIIGAIVALL